jgi:hypothetical protein
LPRRGPIWRQFTALFVNDGHRRAQSRGARQSLPRGLARLLSNFGTFCLVRCVLSTVSALHGFYVYADLRAGLRLSRSGLLRVCL